MIYHKIRKFSNKVIKRNDVCMIANTFQGFCNNEEGTCTFYVSYNDQSSVSHDNAEFFQSDYIWRKDIKAIRFEYRSASFAKHIDFQLREEISFSNIFNTYEIYSDEEIWCDAAAFKLNDLVDNMQNRNWLCRFVDFPWFIFAYIPYQALVIGIMLLSGFAYGEIPEDYTGVFIPLPFFIVGCLLLYTAVVLVEKWLHPEVSFDFNPIKSVRRKKLQKSLGWVITTLLIPIFLTLIVK